MMRQPHIAGETLFADFAGRAGEVLMGGRACSLNGSESVGEPKVRIHFPPAANQLRTWGRRMLEVERVCYDCILTEETFQHINPASTTRICRLPWLRGEAYNDGMRIFLAGASGVGSG
jgi:hypothetical protein